MPSSTRTATPGPSTSTSTSKRPISDAEPTQRFSKKPRTVDPNRESKRRKRRKRKAPIVGLGVTKSEPSSTRSNDRSRPPLSARNEIIRFSSSPPETGPSSSRTLSAHTSAPGVTFKPPSLAAETSSQTLENSTQDHPAHERMPSAPTDEKRFTAAVTSVPTSSDSSSQEKVAQLTAELQSKNDLIASHQALVNQVQQATTCQICLDLMYRPYALAPCGHLACHDCLVQWFTAPPPDNRPVPPPMRRRKTCPHCRAVIRERPIEVWGVKGIAQALGKSGLVSIQTPLPSEAPQDQSATTDPWKDIFPKAGRGSHHALPWFLPGAHIDDDEDDIYVADGAPRGDDMGMLDMEDGGIYRCLDCMHEIWGGVCSSCGRIYQGHRHERDEDEDEDDYGQVWGWLEGHMDEIEDQVAAMRDPTEAEVIDIADDPGWMGLEEGEADDDGDEDDWPVHARRRGVYAFLGVGDIDDEHDEEEDDDDDEHGPRFLDDEAEESEDDGYESSFIDDEDADVVQDLRARIYEIATVDDDQDDEEEEYLTNLRRRIVDVEEEEEPRIYEITNEDEEEEYLANGRLRSVGNEEDDDELNGHDAPRHRRARHPCVTIVVSSEEDGEGSDESEPESSPPPRRLRDRRRRVIESDVSDVYPSDE